MYFAVPPNSAAALPGALPQTAGTVEVSWTQPGGRQHDGGRGRHDGLGPAAEARVPRRRGRRRHAGHPGGGAAGAHPDPRWGICWCIGQLHGGRLRAGGLRHDPERLRLEHRTHLHPDAGETLLLRLPVPAGHGLQLVRQRGRQRLRRRHRHLPRHGRAGSLEHGGGHALRGEPVQRGRACEGQRVGQQVTETDSPSKAVALICRLYRST